MIHAPDYAEPIMGVRTWLWNHDHHGDRLASLTRYVIWESECIEASCENALIRPHTSPDERCYCGLYAYYDQKLMEEDLGWRLKVVDWNPVILGVVSAWGDVDLHDRGFRSQHMKIEALIFDDRFASVDTLVRIAQYYEVPIIYPEDIKQFSREHGALVSPLDVNLDSQSVKERRAQRFNNWWLMLNCGATIMVACEYLRCVYDSGFLEPCDSFLPVWFKALSFGSVVAYAIYWRLASRG